MNFTTEAIAANALRLLRETWYRNLAARWDRDMSFYYCEHLILVVMGPIAIADGDMASGPCCFETAEYTKGEIPVTWHFNPTLEMVVDPY